MYAKHIKNVLSHPNFLFVHLSIRCSLTYLKVTQLKANKILEIFNKYITEIIVLNSYYAPIHLATYFCGQTLLFMGRNGNKAHNQLKPFIFNALQETQKHNNIM